MVLGNTINPVMGRVNKNEVVDGIFITMQQLSKGDNSGLFCTLRIHHSYLQPIITQYFIDNKSEIWLLFLIAHSKR